MDTKLIQNTEDRNKYITSTNIDESTGLYGSYEVIKVFCLAIGSRCVRSCKMLCNAIFLTDIGQSVIAKFLAIVRQKDFWCTMLENEVFMNCIGYSGLLPYQGLLLLWAS